MLRIADQSTQPLALTPKPCLNAKEIKYEEIIHWTAGCLTLGMAHSPNGAVCVAMYGALFSGVGISVASAAHLRTSLLVLCVAVLVGLALKHLWPADLSKQDAFNGTNSTSARQKAKLSIARLVNPAGLVRAMANRRTWRHLAD